MVKRFENEKLPREWRECNPLLVEYPAIRKRVLTDAIKKERSPIMTTTHPTCPYCGAKSEKLGMYRGCMKISDHIFHKSGKPIQTISYSSHLNKEVKS